MSKDLSVIVPRHKYYNVRNGLAFDRKDYDRYDQLAKYSKPVKVDVIDDETDDYITKEDCYGDPLKTITITKFLEIFEVDDLTDWDKGIIALLKCLDPKTKLLLWYD